MTITEHPAIWVEGLKKRFGPVQALDGIDLEVPPATVLGLLGPNGAGKTTMVKILSTLLVPDEGSAEVAGFDVVRDAAELRSAIGLAGQYAAVDQNLTGRENLDMVGRLYHLGRRESRRRAGELLERFDLIAEADRLVKAYSGGMRRRLDLAASLVGQPHVVFLDEPTAGLDPRSRLQLWEVIRQLVNGGTTLLLTTQYLEEADELANKIVVIDTGRVIAEGTADELKSMVGGEVLELTVADRSQARAAVTAIAAVTNGDGRNGWACGETTIDLELGRLTVPMQGGAAMLAETIRRLDNAGIAIADLGLHRPTLDDVFLALTGRTIETGTNQLVEVEAQVQG
jgi:ABC-2 type transport system ATP-binding protein